HGDGNNTPEEQGQSRYTSSLALDAEDEWVQKMEYNNETDSEAPAIAVDAQFMEYPTGEGANGKEIKDAIFEAAEETSKRFKSSALNLNLFKHNPRASISNKRLVDDGSGLFNGRVSVTNRRNSQQQQQLQTSTLERINSSRKQLEETPSNIPESDVPDVHQPSTQDQKGESQLEVRKHSKRQPKTVKLEPLKEVVSNDNEVGKTIKKSMVLATYNDRGSNVSIHDHVVARDKQRNILYETDPLFIWNHGFNYLSSFSVNSEFVLSLVSISELWLIPLAISYDLKLSSGYSCIVTIKNTLDICLELTTMRLSHPAMTKILDPTMNDWREHYFKTMFFADIVSVFPFELLPVEGAHYLWAIRLLRMHKLGHQMKSSPIASQLQKSLLRLCGISQAVSPIIPLATVFLLFMHVQACVIFLAGRLFEFSNHEIEPYKDAGIFSQYMWSLHMSATNIFPLGYHPTNPVEQLITVAFVVCGAGLYACIVGGVSSIAIGIDASGRLYKQKIDELKEYMHWKSIEPVTQRKVLKYYELKYRGKYFEEAELLNEMNESLRMEISTHNCRELISRVPFLRREQCDGKDDLFAGRITSALEPCYYVPGDIVFIQGEIGRDMYFIFSGSVLVTISGKGVAVLRDGAFFGEIALVANIPRTATVQAVSSCVLYKLSQEAFDKILLAFDDVKKNVNKIYIERMAMIRMEEETRKFNIATMLASKISYLSFPDDHPERDSFLEKLAGILQLVTFNAEDFMYTQGDVIDSMVIFVSLEYSDTNGNSMLSNLVN
ncbi:UNVERIFIED_CONTAM: anaphase-promoting complex subunit Hcn1, partial [Siphonaria sp. JEL0065]